MIRSRFGQLMHDAYTPSNIEVFFEFLDTFDEVSMPNGNTYRLKENELQVRIDLKWDQCNSTINNMLELVATITPDDWADIRSKSKLHNILHWKQMIAR